jgi:hypothetical protein
MNLICIIYKVRIQPLGTSHKCHSVTAGQGNNAAHSETYTKPINTLFGENTGSSNIKVSFFSVSTVTSQESLIRLLYRHRKLSLIRNKMAEEKADYSLPFRVDLLRTKSPCK